MVLTGSLAHGRVVRYVDEGSPDWRPVVFFGDLGADMNAFYDIEFPRGLREELRLRLISVERNGFGLTPFDPLLGYDDAVDDVLGVLEARGVRGQFAVVAISLGAPFAAGLAARVPHRVLSLHLAAAAAGPLVARCGTASVLYATPRRLALDPALSHEWERVSTEPLPDLRGLYAPAYLYWGMDDVVVPFDHVREWRRILPRVAALRGFPGEGHDMQHRHWDQILRDVAGVGSLAREAPGAGSPGALEAPGPA